MNRVDLKIVLLGTASVGKTSLVERFVHERFDQNLSYQNVSKYIDMHAIYSMCTDYLL